MASDKRPNGKPTKADDRYDAPEWADGLKQLYDAVVDEPLPDTFKDLLAKLDDSDGALNDDSVLGSKGNA